MTSAVLRGIAIAIAVAALIDPAIAVQRASQPRVVLVNMTQSDVSAIARQLGDDGSDLDVRTPSAHRVPCRPGERCVVVADGSRTAEVPADLDLPIAVVTAIPDRSPNVAIVSATASNDQFGGAAGAARVVIEGRGVAGRQTHIRILDEGAVIGSSRIDWKTDASETVDVPWWPVAAGARTLRVDASLLEDETAAFDNAIDLPVNVGTATRRVLIFDARPSWSSTFVRRALEDDPRFVVEYRARVAPSLTTATPNSRLDESTLDTVPLLVVGAPDALTAGDVDLIDRFVRVRGGSLLLLPERVPAGASTRLFPGTWSEQLLAEAENAGPLRATELLRPRNLPSGSEALLPIVIATPAGNGRIVVSGAMDAWRFRDAAFDRFWTSLAAEAARLGEKVRITFDDGLATPGSRAVFTVHHRALTAPATLEASAVATCDRAEAIRLWPAGSPGMFQGELPIGQSSCAVEAAINGDVAVAGVAVRAKAARPVPSTLASLHRAALASGGVVTDEDNLQPIRAFNTSAPRADEIAPVHPMRSAWWLLPFAGCLSIEWWLRRRNGLR